MQSSEVLGISSKHGSLLRPYKTLTRHVPHMQPWPKGSNPESDPVSESRCQFVGNAKDGGKHWTAPQLCHQPSQDCEKLCMSNGPRFFDR